MTRRLVAAALLLSGCFPSFALPDDGAGGAQATTTAVGSTAPSSVTAIVATASGSGGGCSGGCADCTIEVPMGPNLAACAGGWHVKGITGDGIPGCNRQSGNDGPNPGLTCNAEDLCASGFHVCRDHDDVAQNELSSSPCSDVAGGFFATAQPADAMMCMTGANDIFGCGSDPKVLLGVKCSQLAAIGGSDQLCGVGWNCGSDSTIERLNVTKTANSAGGVLCCKDP